MKQKVRIYTGTTELYRGRISDIPIKESAITKKSIELFDDDDPCIIHQSYVIKEYADTILDLFQSHNTTTLVRSQIDEDLSFLDVEDEDITIELLGT